MTEIVALLDLVEFLNRKVIKEKKK